MGVNACGIWDDSCLFYDKNTVYYHMKYDEDIQEIRFGAVYPKLFVYSSLIGWAITSVWYIDRSSLHCYFQLKITITINTFK